MKIQRYPDLEGISRAAAELFVEQAQLAATSRGRFSVALSGGHTPKRLFAVLASPPFRAQAPWDKIHVFWGDERYVSPDDPRSNYRMARETLLQHVPIPAEQIHPMMMADQPAQAAEQYEQVLRAYFDKEAPTLDLVYLGLGDNGHTASLFPGTPVLTEQRRWVVDVYVAEQDMYRLTLTAPMINQARLVAFLVAGADKAQVLNEVIHGSFDPQRLPAQLIQPQPGELRWLIDEAAAGQLPQK
ncbi:MAG: 6-phosphogluconolactonase [Gemmataceae bacterium]